MGNFPYSRFNLMFAGMLALQSFSLWTFIDRDRCCLSSLSLQAESLRWFSGLVL